MRGTTYDVVSEVSKKNQRNDGTQTPIETAESHRKMKYKTSTASTIAWKQDTLLLGFLIEIKKSS